MDKQIYFDNAATTKPYKEVVEVMKEYYCNSFYNPSGIYSCAKNLKKKIEQAREYLSKTINCSPKEIFFTSGGSEANNWAIKGIAEKNKNKGKHIITSNIEHHSIINTVKYLSLKGYDITLLPVDKYGFIKIKDLENAIREDTILVSIIFANNEIGTIEPIEQIGKICKSKNLIFHTDAIQAYGHVNIDVKKYNIDLMSVSGHKFGGPKGIGFLYKNLKIKLGKYIHGGDQEFGERAGTENVPCIFGMVKAAEISLNNLLENTQKETTLRNYFIKRILEEIPYSKLNGDNINRLSNNINISFKFIEGESLLSYLDQNNICASTGSACASGSLDPSHVLLAIGLPHEIAHGTLRFTINANNTKEEIDFVVEKTKEYVEKLRNMSPLYEDFIKNKK